VRVVPLVLGLLLAAAAGDPRACAHHGPAHDLEVLDRRITAAPELPLLRIRRGDTLRALGRFPAAERDYRVALSLTAESVPHRVAAVYGLAQTLIAQRRCKEALATLTAEIATVGPAIAAPLHALVATMHERRGDWPLAVAAWQQALRSNQPEVDWFLRHAEATRRTAGCEAETVALGEACERNPSVVLQRAWIGALIRSGDYAPAEEAIVRGLQGARYLSGWLLLRAELRVAQDRLPEARLDAAAVLAELRGRIVPGVANPLLEADRRRAETICAAGSGE
jgi:tetratricopeptide (TPR) repeat protein